MNWYKQSKQEVWLKAPLRHTRDGFYYLDLSQKFVTGLLSMVDDESAGEPPYWQKKYNSVEAHISVLYGDELEEGIVVKEIGQDFSFKLGKFESMKPDDWDDMKKIWIFTVESEELENLRERYGLSKKLKGHDFHITIAVDRA